MCLRGDTGRDDRADFTGDCRVAVTDFSPLKSNFGQGGGSPEQREDVGKPYTVK